MSTYSAANSSKDLAAANDIIDAATTADGFEPISEQFRRNLARNTMLTVKRDGALLGFATLDGKTCELVVHPAERNSGLGMELLQQVPTDVPVWAHGNLPAAQHLAEKTGREAVRELLVMNITGEALVRAAEVPIPEQLHLISLGMATDAAAASNDSAASESATTESREADTLHGHRESELLAQWLQANNEAFDWHPEQGGWDMARLKDAMDTVWFNPFDVLFFLDGKGQMQGFHWVKQIPDKPGEVYVVGLAHRGRGKGLGQALIAAGLRRLVECGNTEVILYVEADNQPAVRAYEHLGFSVLERHVLYGTKA